MPFSSYTFNQFATEWAFEIINSSPTYPQSNGQSERYVGIVKQLLRKFLAEGQEPYIALLEYRNTPVCGLKFSPAQLLMSRRLKDKLPSTMNLIKPKVAEKTYEELKACQVKQKQYYDRGTKSLKPHKVGDSVRV